MGAEIGKRAANLIDALQAAALCVARQRRERRLKLVEAGAEFGCQHIDLGVEIFQPMIGGAACVAEQQVAHLVNGVALGLYLCRLMRSHLWPPRCCRHVSPSVVFAAFCDGFFYLRDYTPKAYAEGKDKLARSPGFAQRLARQAQHQPHILHRSARRAFAQIVEPCDQHRLAARFIGDHHQLHLVGVVQGFGVQSLV